MTTAKHSPAPWKNGRDANGNVIILQDDYVTGIGRNPEYQANRALFDTAPELLVFAKTVLASGLDAVDAIILAKQAQELIAKAEGK